MPMLRTAHRYWETLRHLRSPQIWGRIVHRLHTPGAPTEAAAPGRAQAGAWALPARRTPSLTGADRFVFLSIPGALGTDGWDGPSQAKLWRYNQHYFDDLNAEDAASRSAWHTQLIIDWIRQNPPVKGTGWESYPTSLRIVNWIKWSLSGGSADQAFQDSLATQVRWLSRRLETHLLGNHLFVNAKALVFAGAYFSGDEAAAWRRLGSRLLRQEIPEQILRDGGQFERSPMYHALAYEDMLDLYNLAQCFGTSQDGVDIEPVLLVRMAAWLHTMSHPSGELALFNDTADGIAPSVSELDAYAARLGLEPPAPASTVHLVDSGYMRLQEGRAAVLFDVAPVGPDYLPAHAHADTLSVELSLGNNRVLVNSGTSIYAEGPERARQRGTAAHNTVMIDGQDSSEVWSSFRVARRARPFDMHLTQTPGLQRASARHDGYTRLPGKPVHARDIHLAAGRCGVDDHIEGRFERAQTRYHFHPAVKVSVDPGGREGRCMLPDGETVTWHSGEGAQAARLENTTWHPVFGAALPNTCLVIDWSGPSCNIEFRWDASRTA